MSTSSPIARRAFLGATGSLLLPHVHGQTGPVEGKAADMIIHSRRPEDYEMPIDGFLQAITPTESFYVRSHHYTPQVDAERFALHVSGEIAVPVSLNLRELKKLPRVELVGVMECAGNGRAFYAPKVPGLQWTNGSRYSRAPPMPTA